MKALYWLLGILILISACSKNDVSPAQETEFITATWLDCGNPLDCTKSTTTTFEAVIITAQKFTDGNGIEILQIEGKKSAGLNGESISISIPYSGIGKYSSSNTSLKVHYSNGGINWVSTIGNGGAYVEVLKDENGLVEGNFRYIALSTYSNATPPTIGHDDGLFKVMVK